MLPIILESTRTKTSRVYYTLYFTILLEIKTCCFLDVWFNWALQMFDGDFVIKDSFVLG